MKSTELKTTDSSPSRNAETQEKGDGEAGKRTDPRVCTEVTELEDKFQKMTDRLLTEGSTFEEVIETVAERGGPRLTLGAVRDYFRRNLTLQMHRVRHQKRAAELLKASLGNPDSAEGELAAAAFFTGYMSLGRSGSEPTLKDAERARLQRENLHLKQRVLRLKEQREVKELEFLRARTGVEIAKKRVLKGKVSELHHTLTRNEKIKELAPEAVQKIREIYGLVQDRPPLTTGAPKNEEHGER